MSKMFRKSKETLIPTAENMLKETIPNTIAAWINCIKEAKDSGRKKCYLNGSCDDYVITKETIEPFLKANYNLSYKVMSDSILNGKDIFLKASWDSGCAGKIYNENTGEYVTIDELINDCKTSH